MPPLKGTNASKLLASQQNHPLQAIVGAVGVVYELPKKGGSLIPPRTTHRPLTEGNTTKVTEEIPTSRRHYDQTTPKVSKPREGRVPCPSRSTHSPPHRKGRTFMFTPLQTLPPSVETLTNKKTPGFPNPKGIHLMTQLANAPPGTATRLGSK